MTVLKGLFLSLALIAAAALAPAARAQTMGTFSWQPSAKVQEIMERDRVPGIFFFKVPGDIAEQSITWNFAQPQVMAALKKGRFASCQFSILDSKSSRPWGSAQKLADEFGVGPTTTLVVLSYDREVLAMISQAIKRDEFLVNLSGLAKANDARVKSNTQIETDMKQVEEWIAAKRFGDAARRMKQVLDKERNMSKGLAQKAKDLDAKLEAAGKERLAEGKALLDQGKADEAKPILEEVAGGLARYECGKEAKELLKKAK